VLVGGAMFTFLIKLLLVARSRLKLRQLTSGKYLHMQWI
jgi:hypothetical protein